MSDEQKRPPTFEELTRNLPPIVESMETSELEKLADSDDRCAMYELARRYSQYPFVSNTANPKEAIRYVKKLAEIGDLWGRYWLADCYFSGKYDVVADAKKAIQLIEKNAEEGEWNAYFMLANYYYRGAGVEKNYRTAIKWLEKIVAYEEEHKESLYPYMVYKNAIITSSEFECISKSSYEEPRFKLASLYLEGGHGIEQNFGAAAEWLQKAGHKYSFKLGELYYSGGPGLAQDYGKAMEWFEKTASDYSKHINDRLAQPDDSRQALRKLGLCHALGKGAEQDFAKARDYFEKSARGEYYCWNGGPITVYPRAEAELGICHYRLGEKAQACECFERSAEKDDMLGKLWLAYLKSLENKDLDSSIENENYFTNWAERKDTNKLFGIGSILDKAAREYNIEKSLQDVAVSFERLVRNGIGPNLDMLDASEEVIEFLRKRENKRSTYPSKVTLAFYYFVKGDKKKYLEFINEAAFSDNVIANYLLGKYYEFTEPCKAELFLEKNTAKKNVFSINEDYDENIKEYISLSEKLLSDIALAGKNNDLEQANKSLDDLQQQMHKLVAQFTHTLGNVIFPDTIYQVTERLKNKPECRKDVLLLSEAYHSEIIIKLQGELLQQRYANTNPEKFRQLIRSCRRFPDSGDKIKSIDDILDYAASRVAARFLNQHNASLNSIRNKILSLNQISLDALKQKFEDDILLAQSLSAIEWIDRNLRPLKVIRISPLWQKVRILAESHAEALLFGYFSEVLFNAFKYADHAADGFLIVEFDECIADSKTYLTVSFRNPLGNKALIELGTGKGLDAIREDLRQLNDTSDDATSLLVTTNEQTFQVALFFQKDLLLDEVLMPKLKRKVTVE